MFQTNYILVLLFFLAIQASGQYHYIPDNGSNLLLLKEKGDFKVSSSFLLKSRIGIQAGYSPLKKLGISVSYFKHDVKDRTFNEYTSGKVYAVSLGTYGYFTPSNLSKRDQSPGVIEMWWDAYLGYANGNINNTYSNAGASDLNYKKWFLHFGVHMSNRYLGLSYVIKCSSLDYKEGEVSGNLGTEVQVIYDYILENEPYYIWESDLRLHAGIPLIRGYVGLSMINPNNIDKQVAGEMNLIFSTGLLLSIDKLYRS